MIFCILAIGFMVVIVVHIYLLLFHNIIILILIYIVQQIILLIYIVYILTVKISVVCIKVYPLIHIEKIVIFLLVDFMLW